MLEDEIDNLENLAMLSLTTDEKKGIQESLKKIINYIEEIQGIDTENVEPLISVQLGIHKNMMREDETKDLLSKDAFLANSPSHVGGMLQVPVVIQKD